MGSPFITFQEEDQHSMSGNNHYGALRNRLLVSMILVPLIPFVLVLAIGYYYFTTSLENGTLSSMRRIVEDHRQMIDSFLKERKADLSFALQSYTSGELSNTRVLAGVFSHLSSGSLAFVDLGLFDQDGLHVAYHGPFNLTGKVYQDAPWFQEALGQGHYTSDVFLGYRNVPHFIIAQAKEEDGRIWILRATVDTHLFSDLVEKVQIGKTGEAYLLDKSGVFQTERRSGGVLMEKDPDFGGMHHRPYAIKTFIQEDTLGTTYLYATTWLQGKDWLLVVRQQKADAFKALRTATTIILSVAILGGMAIILVALLLTDRILKRLTETDQEKERLGSQLVRASRLAELGEMATGFAHEINNPLQVMTSEHALMESILQELKERGDLEESEDTKELEDSIQQFRHQIDRCGKITQSILKFGRKSEPVLEDINLKGLITDTVAMIEKKAQVHGIELVRDLDGDTPALRGDPGQLGQVLLNLFNNAFDTIVARHGSQGGILDISTRPLDGTGVQITVRDNGQGIEPENLKKVFTPFFTTKPVGKGTGLGLSVCYGIIHSMGGVIEVQSEIGRGSTFTVTLPPSTVVHEV